jgi:hypothetical protein
MTSPSGLPRIRKSKEMFFMTKNMWFRSENDFLE